MELIVVMTVTLLLTGLLLPALSGVRENAHRVICASNLRQSGLAAVIYSDDNDGCLPESTFSERDANRQELMAAHRGKLPENWEGLGWLYAKLYCKAPQVFYCPSHKGEHPYQRYEILYRHPGPEWIYTNYHYAGHLDWDTGTKRRLAGESIVIAADGLRTLRDFNHQTGVNVLWSDHSVIWRDDISRQIREFLPRSEEGPAESFDDVYSMIWELLGSPD